MNSLPLIERYLRDVSQVIAMISAAEVAAATDLLMDAWRQQSRIYVLGNGGSGAIASHFAGDLNKGANVAGRHRFRAIALIDNMPSFMAWSNDAGYEVSMAEPLRNFVEPGDLVIGISGSGNSANVVQAFDLARQAGAKTLSFCGYSGGELRQASDVSIHIPSHNMEQVEDAFSVLCHMLLYVLRRHIAQEPASDNPLLASRADAYPGELVGW